MDIVLNLKAISYNIYYRIFRGRYIISPQGRHFRETVRRIIEGSSKIEGKVHLTIEFRFKDRRLRDLDNLTKSILDACKGYLFDDDSQIYELHTKKVTGCDNDQILINIKQIEAQI